MTGRGLAPVALLLALAGAASGQDRDAPQPEPPAEIEEIVVTITKREESLQEVGAAVSVLGEVQIERANVENLSDLIQLIPNATIKSDDGDTGITLRGISQGFTGQSPVALHTNGVFRFNGSGVSDFYDLRAIEVVRGPAGTVYGRNATAGAINVLWNEPHADWELFGDATFGDYDLYQFRGGVNVPLLGAGDERLTGRFVATRERRDGFVDNLHESSSRDPAGADRVAARGTLASAVSEGVHVSLRGFWTRIEDTSSIARLLDDAFPVGRLAIGGSVIPAPVYQSLGALPPPDDEREVRSRAADLLGPPDDETFGANGTLEWRLGELPFAGAVDLTVVGGFERRVLDLLADADASELAVTDTLVESDFDTWTAEIRLGSNDGGRVDWIAGVFWFEDEGREDRTTLTPLGIQQTFTRERSRGLAPFASGVVRPFDALELFAGVRWNRDELTRSTRNSGLPPFLPASDASNEERFRERTGEIGAKWFWAETHMLYANWARGYKSGGFNDGGLPFGPERIDAWEIGSKSALFDGRLNLSLTAFHYDYTDLQVPQLLGLEILTTNAAEATVWGVELEALARPAPEWTVLLAAGFLDATFDAFCADDPRDFGSADDPACAGATPPALLGGRSDLSGNRLEDSPKWKVSLLTSYTIDLGRLGRLTPVVEYTWRDQYFLGPFNLGLDRVGDAGRTDLRLVWEHARQPYRVELFAENLEDTTVYARTIVGVDALGPTTGGIGMLQPRLFGVRLGVRFEGLRSGG